MAVIEVQAKTMLTHYKQADEIFALKYNFNLYRGCQHQCIYCDSRSECYGIENFADTLVKINAIELLEKELASKRVKDTVGTGSMNDPYMPVEKRYNLTRRALEVIARLGFGVHVITKSDLVLRDIDLLEEVNRVHAVVSFSISTTDDDLARKLEPGAPPPSARYAALKVLAERGIHVGISMMPVLPFIEDNEENISAVVRQAVDCGAEYIIPWFGMSLRDRQRAYYYGQIDRLFPGLRQKYERRFGNQYGCKANNADQLYRLFKSLCEQFGLQMRAPAFPRTPRLQQGTLF